ncbi:N-acetylmuramoyl-L-alanine amidase [Stappia stellulata]|uniref:N-acetylmuramoyl-L-alanine amidase n=1 Tax=Stappia TaxID=152161 RepID=UPI001CD5796D|nr:N-acetylmuramoyl-L-alanine amidase [Stappia stellulata]MCA1241589.1 N-acetylmuramoyl-L-alanine amidase [Stappia stellulata]
MAMVPRMACRFVAAAIVAWLGTAGVSSYAEDTAPATARDARLAGDELRTRFVMDLSKPVDFAVSTLSDPYRVVIDLPQVSFDLDPVAGREGRGLVSDWRFGLFAAGKSRIVLDATAPVSVDKVFVLPPVSDQPARFVIDLVKTTREAFLSEAAETAEQARAERAAVARKGDRLKPQDDETRPLIVLDPGHGGLDTGATGAGGTLEKAVVLDFSLLLRDKLAETGRYDVRMTRDTDVFIPLRERVKIARGHQADLLVSVHADSVRIGRSQVRGAGVYTLSETASDEIAAALAERENRSDVIAGIDLADEPDDVTDILIDLARMETKKFSYFFARTLVDELRGSAELVKNPHRSAGFRVLTAHDVPSALVELGYLSHKLDEKLMATDAWRNRMAEAIVVAIDRYFARRFGAAHVTLSQTAEAAESDVTGAAVQQ